MAYKHACVVDARGYYVNFVLVHLEEDRNGNTVERVDTHIMADGEQLLDAKPPAGRFAHPLWDGSDWTEGGTEEEVAAWEAAKPVPVPAAPSDLDILREEVDAALMELASGLADQEAVNQEQDNAIMEIGGMISG